MYKLKKVFLFCIMCLFCVAVMPKEVEAARYEIEDKVLNLRLYKDGYPESFSCNNSAEERGEEVGEYIKAEVDKEGIVDVEICEDKRSFDMMPLKVGTTNLTLTMKYGSIEKVHTMKVVVRKYVNPVKNFKVGSVQYKNKFKVYRTYYAKVPKKSKQVTVKVDPKKGYKVISIYYYYNKGNRSVMKKLKNGQRFKLRKASGGQISVELKNKKTGEVECLTVFYNK